MRRKEGKSIGNGGAGQRMLRDSHGAALAPAPGTLPCLLRWDVVHLYARTGVARGKLQKGEKILFL